MSQKRKKQDAGATAGNIRRKLKPKGKKVIFDKTETDVSGGTVAPRGKRGKGQENVPAEKANRENFNEKVCLMIAEDGRSTQKKREKKIQERGGGNSPIIWYNWLQKLR